MSTINTTNNSTNPYIDIKQTKYLLIDSRFKTYGSSNNFLYTLSTQITVNNAIKLIYSSIPNSNYLFNSSNNTFTVSYNGSSAQTITFSVGNMRTDQIATSLQSQFLAFFPSSGFTCQFNTNTIQFNCAANNNFYFNFPNSNIASILGFNLGLNYSNSNILNSPNIVYTIYPDYLIMYIDKIFNNNIISSQNIQYSYFIPLTADRSIMNVQNELSTYINIISTSSPLTLSSFTVKLFNPDGSSLDINNCDWVALFMYY